MASTITVISIDDHPLICQAIALQLADCPTIDLVAQGHLGKDVIPFVETHRPNLLLLDIGMPQDKDSNARFQALPTVAHLRKTYPELAIMILTQHISFSLIWAAANLGVQGYIDKSDGITNELINSIVTIHNGGLVFSSTAQKLLLESKQANQTNNAILTNRQLEVLKTIYLAPDMSNAQNAKTLNMSEATFKTHLSNIFKALDAPNKVSAIISGMRLGILPVDWLGIP